MHLEDLCLLCRLSCRIQALDLECSNADSNMPEHSERTNSHAVMQTVYVLVCYALLWNSASARNIQEVLRGSENKQRATREKDKGETNRAANGQLQPVRLAGSYHCWFVKKYCWLVYVREKYCFG